MSDPVRWRDGGAPDDFGDLLAAAPRSQPMSVVDEARMAARIAGVAAAPAGVTTAVVWLRRAGLATGISVAGAIAVLALSSGRARAPTPARANERPSAQSVPAVVAPPSAPSSPAVEIPPAPVATVTPRVRSASPRGAHAPVVAQPIPAPRPLDTMAEQAALLGRAQAALANDPREALARAEEYTARFPRGQLGPERELIAIDALQRLGRTREARARGEAMITRYPRGIYATRVRRLLEGRR